jgi:hypothetical protein
MSQRAIVELQSAWHQTILLSRDTTDIFLYVT